LTRHDGRERLKLIHLNKVLERSRGKEEGFSFLELHGRGELWLTISISKVSYLVQHAEVERERERECVRERERENIISNFSRSPSHLF
jgi:hypothetical protein